jgi:hypothetical protein
VIGSPAFNIGDRHDAGLADKVPLRVPLKDGRSWSCCRRRRSAWAERGCQVAASPKHQSRRKRELTVAISKQRRSAELIRFVANARGIQPGRDRAIRNEDVDQAGSKVRAYSKYSFVGDSERKAGTIPACGWTLKVAN